MTVSSQPDFQKGLHVLMVAAECKGIVKVGGVADVVSDLSQTLNELGVHVSIIMPYYDAVEVSTRRTQIGFDVRFGAKKWQVKAYRKELNKVTVYLLKNSRFFGGDYGGVYIDSSKKGGGPFQDDAIRFAFFSASALELIRHLDQGEPITTLHCHDWQAGTLLFLLKHDLRYEGPAGKLRALFTVHNLDYQGTRPLEMPGGAYPSFCSWFPELYEEPRIRMSLKAFHDPGADVPCFNPMRAAIKLADNVNTVSPTYAQEITLPDCAGRGFKGGRGLEDDFKRLANQGKLHGILNALDYDVSTPLSLDPPFDTGQKDWQVSRKQHKVALLQNLSTYVQDMEKQPGSNFFNQRRVLEKSSAFQPDEWLEKPLVVAVSRAASQKLNILLEPYEADCLVIEEILKRDIFLLLLGTGELQDQLERINDYTNGLFICAFDPDLAQKLYAGGDIFLMPSDFEPCGLSQMIAMRYGCLPLAHDIGGLHDTIRDSQTGFLYAGADREDTRHNLLRRLDEALAFLAGDGHRWVEMQQQAMNARFDWVAAAEQYIKLY